MHWPPFAGTHWRTTARRSRGWSGTLENRLAWNWPARRRTTRHGTYRLARLRSCSSRGSCCGSRRSLINRPRPGLRHNHAWRRRLRTRRRSWCRWPLNLSWRDRRLSLRYRRCSARWGSRRTRGRRRCWSSRDCRRRRGRYSWGRRSSWYCRSHYPGRCSGYTRGGRLYRRRSWLGFLRWRWYRSWSWCAGCGGCTLLFREDRFQNVARLRDVREVDLRLYPLGIGTRRAAGFRALAIARPLQSCAHFVRFVVLE